MLNRLYLEEPTFMTHLRGKFCDFIHLKLTSSTEFDGIFIRYGWVVNVLLVSVNGTSCDEH